MNNTSFYFMKNIIIYLISMTFMIYGLIYIIIYMNLFSIGYPFIDYILFIITNLDCLTFFIGFILLVILSIKKR